MDYQNFIREVNRLGFIRANPVKADAGVKAVLGILASMMEEPDARQLTERLPEPLTFEKLYGHQANIKRISADQYIEEIREQLNLKSDEAREFIRTVLHITREMLGNGLLIELGKKLPSDWKEIILSS
ncbi:MAG: DUF2267 domain-containing protein [Deltaproteobacteria bacterium]|nr:DUF2267 domain-containing protein [Deltaproteobacteria bacterium]